MKMKDVMNLFHISEGTIRYYEKMGVVNPERDENNYRIFDSRSLINLVLCKKCNEYGFSYKESIDLLTKNNFVENTELLKKRSKKIDDEINRLSVISAYCKDRIAEINRYAKNENEYCEERIEASLYSNFGSADLNEITPFFENETIEHWIDMLSVSDFELWQDFNNDRCDQWKWGYTISKDLFYRLGKEDFSFFKEFKSEKYLSTVTRIPFGNLKYLDDRIYELRNYGNENAYLLSGLIRSKMIMVTSEDAYIKISAELKSA